MNILKAKDNIVADCLSRTKLVENISISFSLNDIPRDNLSALQESDLSLKISSIPSDQKSNETGVWRDYLGRLFVPIEFRENLIKNVHEASHSGINSTLKQLKLSYIWPKINKHVKNYVSSCDKCQRSKIIKHCKPPIKSFGNFSKFEAIHIDFVGPLPSNNNKKYLFTVFDRCTRLFHAFPVSNCSSESACACLREWFSLFGVPKIIISDQGTHFESTLFNNLLNKLNIRRNRTTPYHPSCNGAVERQHRIMKSSLKAKCDNNNWLNNLHIILLGMRNAISDHSNTSASLATYGKQLNLPHVLFDNSHSPCNNDNISTPILKPQYNSFLPKHFETCNKVLIRKPGILKSLEQPYAGSL